MISQHSQLFLPVTTEQQIHKLCECMIGNFINEIDLSYINFPLLKTTYTLWRKVAFKIVSEKFGHVKDFHKKFSAISQGQYLPLFVERLEANIKVDRDGFKKIIHSAELKQVKNEEQQQLISAYGNLIFKQQMYVQLIEDLTKLPYFDVFRPQAQMNVKENYVTIFTKRKKNKIQTAQDFIGSTLIMKGLNAIGEKAVMATSVASTVAGFNPMLTAMSFGLSKSFNAYKQYRNRITLLQQLDEMKQQTLKNVIKLQQIYKACLSLLQIIISKDKGESEDDQLKKKLRNLFFQVFQQEWLNISIQQDGDWEIIRISEDQNFQVI